MYIMTVRVLFKLTALIIATFGFCLTRFEIVAVTDDACIGFSAGGEGSI